jgi:hypothetical protein
MRMTLLKILRSLASILFGYIVIVVCTIVGFKPLGGIVHLQAPLHIQAAGALVAIVSGLMGGVAAALVGGRHPVRHAAGVLIFLCVDTAVVLSRGSTDPVWFDLSGSATLMLATVSGGVLYHLVTRRRRSGYQPSRDGADPIERSP